ncbi:helix-turn-helix domain-containing protein [Rhodococcus sp. NPDC003318]|uniref:helix-turn-helix domain-containing protein n=1 Tax=Rhodococcus sp. NPDC003318 TaxID=3364503 RepID=UPI00369FB127
MLPSPPPDAAGPGPAQRDSLSRAGVPVTIAPLRSDAAGWARVRTWRLGSGVLVHGAGSAVAVGRARSGDADRTSAHPVTLASVSPGDWAFTQRGVTVTPLPDDHTLILVDHAAPHDFRRHDAGSAASVTFDRRVLDVPATDLPDAARLLRDDATRHDLFRTFLRDLVDVAERSPASLTHLVDATVDRARALIIGAAAHAGRPADSGLIARIRCYIDDHLTDPDLGPHRVAAAHNISVRSLYSLWSGTGTTLGNHIVTRRLKEARKTLVDNGSRHLTIAAIAQRHGFTDVTHFTRRFRDAYGVTPGRLRRSPTEAPGAPSG